MKLKLFLIIGCVVLVGCFPKSHPDYLPQIYKAPDTEAPWIRSGEPLVYQDRKWMAADDTESLTDMEVLKVGEYQDVEFFAAKEDVEPYQRLYTKFGRNRYRYFLPEKS